MNGVATVRVGPLTDMPTVLQEFGVEPKSVFARSGVPLTLLDNWDNVVPVHSLGEIAANAVAATGCDHIGLLVGRRARLAWLGRVGFIAQNSHDVMAALTSLAAFLHNHDRSAALKLTVVGDVAHLSYLPYDAVPGLDQIVEGAAAIMCQIMRTFCGSAWAPSEVKLARRMPKDTEAHKRYFRSKVRFDAGETTLVFGSDWLSHPVTGAEPELRRLLLGEIGLYRPYERADMTAEVRRVVRTFIGSGHCHTETVARLFGMNQRALHRQLASEGTNFKRLADEARFDVAKQLLRSTGLSLSKISEQLDYSELSAFDRAFSRWSGASPGEWRRGY